jgi:hypothetical protein
MGEFLIPQWEQGCGTTVSDLPGHIPPPFLKLISSPEHSSSLGSTGERRDTRRYGTARLRPARRTPTTTRRADPGPNKRHPPNLLTVLRAH